VRPPETERQAGGERRRQQRHESCRGERPVPLQRACGVPPKKYTATVSEEGSACGAVCSSEESAGV